MPLKQPVVPRSKLYEALAMPTFNESYRILCELQHLMDAHLPASDLRDVDDAYAVL